MGASLGSVAVLSALLYYFGWVHTAAQAKYFGLDSTFYNLSSADYTLRSVGAALPTFAVGIIIVFVVVLGIDALDRHVTSSEARQAIVLSTVATGSILLVVGVVALVLEESLLTAWPAILLLTGAALGGTGVVLSRLKRRASMLAAVVLLAVVGAFHSVRVYATTTGRDRAERSALEMDATPIVSVYAAEDPELLRVGSVRRFVRVSETGATLYRYDCLHVLDRIGDQLFLVPHGYSTNADRRVLYVVDRDVVRIDVDVRYLERGEDPPCSGN